MCYDVQSKLILFDDVLRYRKEPDRAETKNGEITMKLGRSSTYASLFALIQQCLKMSLGFSNLSDT